MDKLVTPMKLFPFTYYILYLLYVCIIQNFKEMKNKYMANVHKRT